MTKTVSYDTENMIKWLLRWVLRSRTLKTLRSLSQCLSWNMLWYCDSMFIWTFTHISNISEVINHFVSDHDYRMYTLYFCRTQVSWCLCTWCQEVRKSCKLWAPPGLLATFPAHFSHLFLLLSLSFVLCPCEACMCLSCSCDPCFLVSNALVS